MPYRNVLSSPLSNPVFYGNKRYFPRVETLIGSRILAFRYDLALLMAVAASWPWGGCVGGSVTHLG